jgi:hypothetical protein
VTPAAARSALLTLAATLSATGAAACLTLAYHADTSVRPGEHAWWDTRRVIAAGLLAAVSLTALGLLRRTPYDGWLSWLAVVGGVVLAGIAGAYTAAAHHPLTGPDLPLMNAEQTWDPETLGLAARFAVAALVSLIVGLGLGALRQRTGGRLGSVVG